jgi:hypothetical protein
MFRTWKHEVVPNFIGYFRNYSQVWLLRHKKVEQLHKFIHIVLSASFPALYSRPIDASSTSLLVDAASPVALQQEAQLTSQELQALEAHERSGHSADAYRRLLKLGKYFRGLVPLEEILWREGETLEAIQGLLAQFKRFLVVSERPL